MALENWYHAGNTHRPGRAAGSQTRVLVMGDSLGVGLYNQLGGLLTGLNFSHQFIGFSGTGLLDFNSDTSGTFAGPLHRWCKPLNVNLNTYDPDIVVIWYTANYRQGSDPGQPNIDPDTPEFYAAWLAEATHMTNLARGTATAGNTRQIIWLRGPAMDEDSDLATRTNADNYLTIQDTYKRTGFVSAYKHLPDPRDSSSVFDPDGTHLTTEGYLIMADAVVDRLVP